MWQQRSGTISWSPAGTATTDSNGYFSMRVTPTMSAAYQVRWGGGRRYTAATSTPVAVAYEPTIPTTVSFRLSRARAYAGQQVELSGTVTSATGNVAKQSVEVYRQAADDGAPALAATVSTDRSGAFSLAVGASETATYTVRFPGTSVYESADAAPSTMTLLLPQRTQLTMSSGRSTLRAGRQITLRGQLRTAAGKGIVHRRIRIYRRVFGDPTWQRVHVTRTVGPRGGWSVVVHPYRGSIYRAEYGGAMRFKPSKSNRLRLRVS